MQKKDAMPKEAKKEAKLWGEFEAFIEYFRLDAKNQQSFRDMNDALKAQETKRGLSGPLHSLAN